MNDKDEVTMILDDIKGYLNSKIVGKICMCQTMLNVKVEEIEKEIFGKNNSIYEIAKYCDVSVYYLLSKISNRVIKEKE